MPSTRADAGMGPGLSHHGPHGDFDRSGREPGGLRIAEPYRWAAAYSAGGFRRRPVASGNRFHFVAVREDWTAHLRRRSLFSRTGARLYRPGGRHHGRSTPGLAATESKRSPPPPKSSFPLDRSFM